MTMWFPVLCGGQEATSDGGKRCPLLDSPLNFLARLAAFPAYSFTLSCAARGKDDCISSHAVPSSRRFFALLAPCSPSRGETSSSRAVKPSRVLIRFSSNAAPTHAAAEPYKQR